MFLFTTPPAAAETKPQTPVLDAIRTGSERTGADFSYLLKTAQRESSLDPEAKARTSSASGLFQFVEQTWLGMVKGAGAEHGLAPLASAISETRGGRFEVADPAMKSQILALRSDPRISSVMAGELTRRNGASLAAALGRQPTQGDLYVAHVMGASGGAELIRKAQSQPTQSAAAVFPDQAGANRGIFYDKASGRARNVGEVYAVLSAGASELAVPSVPQLKSDPTTWFGSAAPVALATAYAHQDGPALHGLFRTEGQRGPMNQTVQKLWSGLPARPASSEDLPRYFPRTASLSTGVANDAGPAPGLQATPGLKSPTAVPAAPAAVSVPLPPERPSGLAAVEGRQSHARAQRGPLDLTTFLKPKV
jgi:hypothetical protein